MKLTHDSKNRKQAVLIQCHDKPELLNRLIDFFPSEEFDLFVHIDKKSKLIVPCDGNNVFYVKNRIDVRWGRSSQIEATLSMLDMFNGYNYSYVHLISGKDMPIKSIDFFINYFSNNNLEFIESNSLPKNSTWSWGGEDRYRVFYPRWIIHRPTNKIFKGLRVIYREFVMKTHCFQRKKFPCDSFYGGSSWFSLTGNCIEWIKDYLNKNQDYLKFFRHTCCGDELFFSTLVRLSPYNDKIANNCLRYMKWDGSKTGGPSEIVLQDLNNIINSNCIFARKVNDKGVFDGILNKIGDCHIKGE